MRARLLLLMVLGCAPDLPPGGAISASPTLDAATEAAAEVAPVDGGKSDAWSKDPRCPVGYCKGSGMCQYKHDGVCFAATNADCAQSTSCIEVGTCAADTGQCVFGPDDAACAAAKRCKSDALCALWLGKCRPGSEEHCKQSVICTHNARCTFKQHECIPGKEEDCAQSGRCKTYGECHFVLDGSTSRQGSVQYSGRCRATSDADCEKSTNCQKYKDCWKNKNGTCTKKPP